MIDADTGHWETDSERKTGSATVTKQPMGFWGRPTREEPRETQGEMIGAVDKANGGNREPNSERMRV